MDAGEGLLRFQWRARGKACHRRGGRERRIGILWQKAVGGQRFEQKNVSVSTESGKEVQE